MATFVRSVIMTLMALALALPASAFARPQRPARPGGVHATYITRTGVSLTWQRMRTHRVRHVAVLVNGKRVALLGRRSHRVTLRKLRCSRRYAVTVQGRAGHGRRARPLRRVVETARCRPPAPPAALRTTTRKRRRVTFAWRRPRSHSVKRVVVFADGRRIARLPRKRHRFTLTGLACGQRYHVRLEARARGDRHSRRARFMVRTAACRPHSRPPAPPAPSRLRATRVTRTSVLVQWRRLRSPEVKRVAVFLGHRRVAVLPRLHHRFRVAGLRCARRYRLSAESHGRRGHTSRRTHLAIRTVRCAAGLPGRRPDPPPAPSPSSAVPCGVSAAAPATYDHVIWILFENKTYGQVMGNPSAPYMSQVAARCATVANWADAGGQYPSLPSYLALTSGDNQQVTDDSSPGALPAITADNIFRQVRARGLSERSYQEDMPGNCAQASGGRYAVRHNPAAYYQGADDRAACLRDDVPMGSATGGAFRSDLANGTLPSFAFVTPNLCNDMHDCSVATGDAWLSRWLPAILDSPAYRGGRTAVFVIWDEDTPIPNFEIAPSVKPGTVVQGSYSHYSLLRATEEMLGLPVTLGQAATAPSLRGPLGL
jgi:hypothetical protein